MAGLDDILKMLPIDQIAQKLGVDADTARAAVQQGGGAILSGLQANAATPQGSAAIDAALHRHGRAADAGAIAVDEVDTDDGEKILGHVFGGRQQEVAQTLTQSPKTAGIDFGQLLPLLAPIVMGLLARKKGQQPSASSSGSAAGGAASGGIGDLIGGLLGGGAGRPGGFDIGGLLGGLMGGSK